MAHVLAPLPYAIDALEPYIDKVSMEIHHGKHHATYITKLNEALATAPDLAVVPVDDLVRKLATVPESIKAAVRNHGGGHSNHSLFWKTLGPNAGGEPVGVIADAINGAFSSFANLKDKLSAAALGRFGSGWAWLVLDPKSGLEVTSSANQDSPLSEGKVPLFGIDVWEHAYYLKYQNRRNDYVNAIWNVVNWKEVNDIFVKNK